MDNKIIQISAARISKAKKGYCSHKSLAYSTENGSIECLDCSSPIGAFKAFMILAQGFGRASERLEAEKREFIETKKKDITLLAAKKAESAWRKKNLVPACPHCHRGVLASDGFGNDLVSKEIEIERRKFERGCE